MRRRLTPEEKDFFEENGYLAGLKVLNEQEIDFFKREAQRILDLKAPGLEPTAVKGWHMRDRSVFQIATHPQLLDYLEDLLGPNLLLWGNRIFCKQPGSNVSVAWHQDISAWPLYPYKTVTVWLAVDDSDAANGALEVIPGSHKIGELPHTQGGDGYGNALDKNLGIRSGVDETKKISLTLKKGEVSIHHTQLVHGSPVNPSPTRRRCGFTFRYCPPEVHVADPNRWKDFKVAVVRGKDPYQKSAYFHPPADWLAPRSPEAFAP